MRSINKTFASALIIAMLMGIFSHHWWEGARPVSNEVWPATKFSALANREAQGYIDSRGRFVTAPNFRSARKPVDGYALYKQKVLEGKGITWGVLRIRDLQQFPFEWKPKLEEWDQLEPSISLGLISRTITRDTIPMGRFAGFSDLAGEWVIEPRFEWVGPFSEGLARVRKNGKYGYISRSGEIVIPAQYEPVSSVGTESNEVSNFNEGVAMVRFEQLYGMIDRSGAWIVAPTYKWLSKMRFGVAVALEDNSIYRLIDARGVTILGPFEHPLRVVGDGMVAAEHEGLWALWSFDGHEIAPPQWQRLEQFS